MYHVFLLIKSPIKYYVITEGDFKAEEVLLTFSEGGARSFPYPVEIFDDAIAEGIERLTVRLSTPPGETGVTFHRNSADISIVDDDSNANNLLMHLMN